MRRYDDQVDVRRGLVAGQEAPAEFWWRGKHWAVRAVAAHWMETGAWWEQPGVAALLGVEADSSLGREVSSAPTRRQNRCVGAVSAEGESLAVGELLAEREVWRVEATRSSYSGSGQGADRPDRPEDSPSHGTSCREVSSAPTRRQNRCVGAVSAEEGFGVFELCFDWAGGQWRLVGSVD